MLKDAYEILGVESSIVFLDTGTYGRVACLLVAIFLLSVHRNVVRNVPRFCPLQSAISRPLVAPTFSPALLPTHALAHTCTHAHIP